MHRRIAIILLLSLACGAPAVLANAGGPDPLEIFPAGPIDTVPNAGPLFPISVPSYHSYPSANAKLYLNFTGDVNYSWGGYSPGITPAYDADGDTSTFSATELSNINQIWQRVSEKYSPFNIDVTTEKPADMSVGHTQTIVIGGKGSWFGLAGGVSFVNSFSSGPNISYVFSDNLAQSNHGVPKYCAEASSHEAGHAFGLVHQSDWVNGSKVNEYSFGTYNFIPNEIPHSIQPGSKSPTMGNSYYADRGIWWSGTSSDSPYITQTDLETISNAQNGFGYRPDGTNNSFATAAPLTIDGASWYHGQGVIESMTDADHFSFDTAGGLVSFLVDVAPFGATLDASAKIIDSTGQVLAQSATSSLSELISANLSPGTYDLIVSGAGNYGDVGQYFITGSLGALVPEPCVAGAIFVMFTLARRTRTRAI